MDVARTNLSPSLSFPGSREHFLYFEEIIFHAVSAYAVSYEFYISNGSQSNNLLFVLVKPKC